MKIKIINSAFAAVLAVFASISAYPDEISDLKEQLRAIEERHQKEMSELRARIDSLEKEKASAAAETPEKIEERVAVLEEKSKKPYEGGMLSLGGKNWKLGGKLEVDYVATKEHAGMDEKSPYFNFYAFKLYPEILFTDDISMKGEIEFGRTAVELKKMYMLFEGLPYKTYIKPGLDYRFIRPSRKTARYPLAGNAFWRDSELGIFAGGEFDPLYWRFSYTSGETLASRKVTEDNSIPMIHDSIRTSDYVAPPGEIGLGLGLKKDLQAYGKIDALGFWYFSKLSSADENFLLTNVANYSSTGRTQYKYGANINYSVSDANLFTQLIKAQDGDLSRFAWYIQPSYSLDFAKMFNRPGWKYFYAVEPLFRYGGLYSNLNRVSSNSLTWDREEYTVGAKTTIFKNIYLKTEYNIDHCYQGEGGNNRFYGEFIARLEADF